MKPEVIDLFVDRLCGIFPRDNIARNTVKNAWNRDDFLLGVPDEHGKQALQTLEGDDQFPSLKRVKEVFRKMQHKTSTVSVTCPLCQGTGWDTGERWLNGEMTHGKYIEEWRGHKYPVVKRCDCAA
jgi:hypothetical protein